jgi:hypothetical protein
MRVADSSDTQLGIIRFEIDGTVRANETIRRVWGAVLTSAASLPPAVVVLAGTQPGC